MRPRLLEILSVILILGSFFCFYWCLRLLTNRDYVGAILVMFIGFAVIRVGSDMAKLSLWDGRDQ
jgi:hypothetical protein